MSELQTQHIFLLELRNYNMFSEKYYDYLH